MKKVFLVFGVFALLTLGACSSNSEYQQYCGNSTGLPMVVGDCGDWVSVGVDMGALPEPITGGGVGFINKKTGEELESCPSCGPANTAEYNKILSLNLTCKEAYRCPYEKR